MSFSQNPFLLLKKEINAGGIDHVPPTGRLLPARASACVPAYVEPAGWAGTKKLPTLGSVRRAIEKGPVLQLELAS